MSDTWYSDDEPPHPRPDLAQWLTVIARGLPLAVLMLTCLTLLLLLRLIEAPLHGTRRPWTPHITVFACRNALRLLGIRYRIVGRPMSGPGAVVANHSSWLDILSLNAAQRVYFVSKAEVAKWPGIGWLARATGTVFIERDRQKASAHIATFRERLAADHRLLFFPEGTSTDGRQVLPFKPTLFAAFFADDMPDLALQPATVVYEAPAGEDARFYGWWGTMDFGPHLLTTLAAKRQGRITVHYHAPVTLTDFTNRKTLAKSLETAVRSGLPT